MVALGSASPSGQTIVAKNSDRPADECQPLVLRRRRAHAPGAVTRCQFLELPEAAVTYRHVGSRPHWCWGYEHGFNEHQVVIGNEAVFSRCPESAEPKLIGMEIIRLGLERARTAPDAVEVMTDAISLYGQGKFANDADVLTYDNSYIVADPREAFVIETAGHEWAVKRVERAAGISNHHSISTDWSSVSPSAEREAIDRAWWKPEWGRLDFARAYAVPRDYGALRILDTISDHTAAWTAADLTAYLSKQEGLDLTREEVENVLSGSHNAPWRCARSNDLLRQNDGSVTARTMMSILSDHGDGRVTGAPLDCAPSTRSGTICYHQAPDGRGGNTAASLVADLCGDGSRLPIYWCSLYSPCLGLFLPIFMEGDLPKALSVGGASASAASPWWQFRELSRSVYEDIETRGPQVRERWAPLQEDLLDTAHAMASEGRRLRDAGQGDECARLLTRYMEENTATMLTMVAELLSEFEAPA